ncbi:MAG: hypothetical protein M3Y50_00435 [Acidobacteriota bacterium]|nr:hypothetical protein [Acidobacteriota bacterium]
MATSAQVTLGTPIAERTACVLHLWHLLSLDAPTVAALWTYFVARTTHVPLPPASASSMFVAVWMLYAADRILDSRPLSSNSLDMRDLEARHLFHHRHRMVFLSGILACSLLLATLLPHLAPEALRLYAILAALLSGWLLMIHGRPSSAHRLPKELAVGIFFPAAIFVPTVARHPDLRLSLLPHALLFAAVCSLNCLCIYAWEHPQPYIWAHWTTRLSTRHLRTLACIIVLTGVAFTALSCTAGSPLWALSCAASISALSLLLLDRAQHRLSPVTLRASADLALLTPLLLLALHR